MDRDLEASINRHPDPSHHPSKRDVSSIVRRGADRLEQAGVNPGRCTVTLQNVSCSVNIVDEKRAEEKGGIFSRAKKVERKILDGVTCSFPPGSLTVVIGSRASGKTTMLKLLSGRLSSEIHVSGDFLIDGHKPGPLLATRRAGYVDAEDVHFAYLTVEETVRFAARCRLPRAASNEAVDDAVKNVLELLALSHVAGNLVGNSQMGGISGGQRRRVTIALEMVAHPQLLIMDEPSTGLDAPMTLDIVTACREYARRGRTVVMSLLQPSEEAFMMFDNAVLLSAGRVVYCGPVSQLDAYVRALGYRRPDYITPKRVPDFVNNVLEPESASLHDDCLPPGGILSKPRLIAAYQASPLRPKVEDETQRARAEGAASPHTDHHAAYAQGVLFTLWLCLLREVSLRRRNKQQFKARIIQSLATGFISGTLFLNLPHTFNGAVLRIAIVRPAPAPRA
eukprot:tig00000057_g128.t1